MWEYSKRSTNGERGSPKWKTEVEDCTEETMPGIHKYFEKAKNEDEEVSEVDWDEEPWNQREMIWRFLKRYTTGEAKKVVTSVSTTTVGRPGGSYIFNLSPH